MHWQLTAYRYFGRGDGYFRENKVPKNIYDTLTFWILKHRFTLTLFIAHARPKVVTNRMQLHFICAHGGACLKPSTILQAQFVLFQFCYHDDIEVLRIRTKPETVPFRTAITGLCRRIKEKEKIRPIPLTKCIWPRRTLRYTTTHLPSLMIDWLVGWMVSK